MHPRLPRLDRAWQLATLVLSLAGCGGALASTSTATSSAPAPDAFTCVREQIKQLGFTQTSFDSDELRVTARRFDEKQRRPDVQFRRMVDRLEVDVSPGTGGAVTSIAVDARTFAELATHRGPTEEEENASATARAAARTILERCSQPVDSTSVPG